MLAVISLSDKPMPTPALEPLVTAPLMPKLHKFNSALTMAVSVAVNWACRLTDAKALLQQAVRANYPRAKLDLAQVSSQQKGAADLSLYLQALQSVMRSAQIPIPPQSPAKK